MQASERKLKNEDSDPESIQKLCRLETEGGPDGNKAYAINTQAQWDEERCNVDAIIQNGRHVSCVVLYGWKIKANADCCVIREKSVLIPVNSEFSILIPVNQAQQPPTPFPTL